MIYLAADNLSAFSTLDILYMSLALGAIILTIVISVVLINLTMVLKDVRKISNTAGDLSAKFHSIVATPLNLTSGIIEKAMPHIESFLASKFRKDEEETEK